MAEEKRVEKVVTSEVKTKKKSEVRKLGDTFIAGDASNVMEYIVKDVLVPTVKKTFVEIIKTGVEMFVYGDKGRPTDNRRTSNYVSYNSYSDRRDERRVEPVRSGFDFDDFIFESYAEADAVRDQMDAVIERYGYVTVSDLYDMVDRTAPYTANKYGWTNLRNAEPVRVREGYMLKLPKAMPIS